MEDQQNSATGLIVLQGFPTPMSLLKPKCSLVSNTVAQNRSLSQRPYLLERSFLAAPVKALAHSFPCPHEEHMENPPLFRFSIICHVPVQQTQQNKPIQLPICFLPSKKLIWRDRSMYKAIPCSGPTQHICFITWHLHAIASAVSPQVFKKLKIQDLFNSRKH